MRIAITTIQSDLLANILKNNNLENHLNQHSKFYFGKTSATSWQAYSSTTVYQLVDISQYKFQNPPIVLTSLPGGDDHWTAIGATHVSSITKYSFIIYLGWDGGAAMDPSYVLAKAWYIMYVVVLTDP